MRSIKIITHQDYKQAYQTTTIRRWGTMITFTTLLNNLARYCDKTKSDITIELGRTDLISYDDSDFNPWRKNKLEIRELIK